MHILDENIPFSLAKQDTLNSDELDILYKELLEIFPDMYSLLMIKDAELILEKYHAPA